jgi:hypothetical protein
MSTKSKLSEIIISSKLNENDKQLWNKFIEVTSEDIISDIYEALKDDKIDIKFLTKNLKEKLDAFVNQDENKLNEIIGEEADIIKNLDA